MTQSVNLVMLSRVLVPLLGLVVWSLVYLNARLAYRMPRGAKRAGYQLLSILAAIFIFVLQVNIMDRLSPGDAYGDYFFGFVVIEGGGGLVVLFTTLLRERAKSRKGAPGVSSTPGQSP